jgi:hypothetical protein
MSLLPSSNKDFVAISIKDSSVSYPPSSKLFCNLCSCNLVLLDAEKEEWFCTRCNVSYFPNKGQKVKRANKFETPGPETDSHGNITGERMPIVSTVKDDPEPSSVYTGSKPSPYFENLAKRSGVILLDYHTSEY